ncbi:MAG: hypothetical protein E7039_08355 [Lentisphaerae bacterium]|nr:hypothetical protein [Lentisphaerota bacterium]
MTFGIIAMILVGASWIIWGFAAGAAGKRNFSMGLIVAASAVIGILITIPSIFMQGLPDFSTQNLWLITALVITGGVFNYLQLQWMGRAMKFGPNGIIWSIIQLGFICPFAVGIMFFNVPMSWSFAVAVLLVIAALVIFAFTADNESRGKWLLWTILSFFATCSCQSLQNIPSYIKGVDSVSGSWRTLAFFAGLLLGFFIYCIFDRNIRSEAVLQLKSKYIWLIALFIDVVEVATCSLLLYPGMDALAKAGQGAIATQLMTASSIVCFELYAVCWLKEKRNAWQIIALAACLASIVAVSFTHVLGLITG